MITEPKPKLNPKQELLYAAECGDIGSLVMMLNRGVKAPTALHNAAKGGHVSCLKALLARGADINAINDYRQTAVFVAACYGKLEALQELISEGADTSIPDGTPKIQDFFHIFYIKNRSRSPLHAAAEGGHTNCVLELISHGIQIDIVDADGDTALHYAIKLGHTECANKLITHGAQINKEDCTGYTPLHLAICRNNLSCVRELISHGAQINARVKETWSAVKRDLRGGSPDYGLTALHLAAKNGDVNCVRFLLENGAKIDFENSDVITPVNTAYAQGHTSIAKLIQEEKKRRAEAEHRQQEAKKRAETDQHKIDYINSGNTNYQQGNYDEAIKWYEKALSIDPNYQPARIGKENALKQLNNKLELERQKKEPQKQINMTIDFPYNKYIRLSKQQKIKLLLDVIGKADNDAKQIGNIYVTRREVADSISNENNYYTADFINILVHSLNQPSSSIRTYPAISIDNFDQYNPQIQTQKERYSFIPINIEYYAKSPKQKNHWAALIIDKQNQLIFYLDPAQKTAIPKPISDLITLLGYNKPIILNPIDFQKKEKEEGWVRHCGPYIVEIFKIFKKVIQKGQCIAGGITPDSTIANSISAQTALSKIPCGDAEIVNEIREEHIDIAYKCLTGKSINLEEVQSAVSSSQSETLRDIPTPSLSSANPSALFDEMKTLKRAYEKLEQKSQETVTAHFTAAEKEKTMAELKALRPLINVLNTGKFGKGLLGQFYILLRIHLKELFTAASNLSSRKVKRADYLVKDKVKNSLGAFAKGAVPFAEALGCASESLIELLKTASEVIHISEFVENILETAGFDPILKKGIAAIFGPSEEKKLAALSSLAIDNTHQDIMMERIACRLTESYKPIINYLETQGLKEEGIKELAQNAGQRIWGVLRRNPHIKDLDRNIDLIADQLVAWVSHYPLGLIETIKNNLGTLFKPILTLQQGNEKIPLTAYEIFSHAGVTYFSQQKACWQYYAEKEDSLHATIGFRKVTSEIGQQIVENPTSFYAQYWEKVKPVSPFIQDPESTTSASQETVKALESKINEVAKQLKKIQPLQPTINKINITVGTQMQQMQNTAATSTTTAAVNKNQNKHINSTLQQHGQQLGLFGETLAQHNEKLEKLENSDNGRSQKISPSSVDRFCLHAATSIHNYIETNQSKIKAATFDLPLFSEPMTFFYTKKLSEEKENLARRLIQSLNRATSFSEIKTVLEGYLQEDKRLSQKYEKNPDTLSEKINNLIQQVKLELSANSNHSSTAQLKYG